MNTASLDTQGNKKLHEADRVLIDAPCSGVLKRNPDAKWKLNLNLLTIFVKFNQKF
jgi:16S rRNA C967 or C1407 C5-methylase (RsmB/RsmF family)